jgi:hypothetical protein
VHLVRAQVGDRDGLIARRQDRPTLGAEPDGARNFAKVSDDAIGRKAQHRDGGGPLSSPAREEGERDRRHQRGARMVKHGG